MLERRQRDIVERFKRPAELDSGFATLAPHAIEKLLAGPKPDARVIAKLLDECIWSQSCREAIDVLAERFRVGNLQAPLIESLRRELIKVVREWCLVIHFPNTDDCFVLLAYCGDKQGLEETRSLAMRTWGPKDRKFRARREEVDRKSVV